MSKLRKQLKKWNAGLLAAAVVISSLHISGAAVEAAEPEFNADDVVLRVGVLSDPHFMYTDDDANVDTRVSRYKNAITYLNQRADADLDMIMLAGDYTGTGSEVQATAFAKATKEALDSINEGKQEADATKLIFAYGNHDTDWSGQMDYAGWENVLNQYGILDSVEKGPEGCYKSTVTNSGKTYHFYSLETYNYNNPCNMFLTEALDWLDDELKTVTTTDPDSYVYVVSHGGIWESGVYGTDFEFDRNATWGTAKAGFKGTATGGRETSSDVHNVLRKYPQVVYFSGHTHRTNILESTIMQKDYTAINVSSVNGGDFFTDGTTDFVEGNYDASRPGHVLLVEVDGNGNQRITRINIENNSVCGEPWVMSAPNAEKTHLETYTQEARQKTPVFASGAAFSIDNIEYTEGKEQMTFDVSFDAATCDNYIFRYELVLYDQNGKSIDTKWMVGNWTDHKIGVVAGTSHLDATKFKYSLTVESADLFGATGIYAKLYAVDEFGGRSEALTWKSQDSLQEVALMKPTGDKANRNLLDGFTNENIATFAKSGDSIEIVDNGNTSLDVTTTSTTQWQSEGQMIYTLNDTYATSITTGAQGILGRNATKLTTLDVDDTFVWETDFTKMSGGDIYLSFRAPNQSSGHWKSAYSGLLLTSSGAELWLDYERIATSDAFKLNDTATHRIKIVSAPTKVSIWVDDIEVFADADFTYPEASLELSGSTYVHSYVDLDGNSRTSNLNDLYMYPAIGVCAKSAAEYSLDNQLLYLYNSEDQVADSTDVLTKQVELYDANSVGCDRTQFQFSDTENKINVTTNSSSNEALWFTQTFDDSLAVTDTVITELEYTPTNMTNTDSSVWTGGNIVGIQIRFRTDGSKNATVYLRVNGPQNMIYFSDSEVLHMSSTAQNVVNGQKVKVKIVSDNTKASIWINDVLMAEDFVYTSKASTVDTANMKPILQVGLTNATWEISNISVKKAAETIPNVTPLTEENNLLESQFANISSNIMTWGGAWANIPVIINGTNIYTDMRTSTMLSAGVAEGDKYTNEQFSFWGVSGNDPKISPNESYVFSTLAKIYNTTAENGGVVSRYRMKLASYNGVTTGFILDDTTLKIMENEMDITRVDLASKIGYAVGNELRVTALVSPFGWDLYLDGYHVYSYKVATGSTVDYRVLQLSTGGAKVRFLDTSVHYNNDNGELYKEKILEQVANYEVERKGIWYENKAEADAEVAKIKALCEGLNSTSNETLKTYIHTVGDAISSGKVTNNMVWDGSTSLGEDAYMDLDPTKQPDSWDYGSLNFFGSGHGLKQGETWLFEADVYCASGWYNRRVGFGLNAIDPANPDVMIQNGTKFFWSNTWDSSNGNLTNSMEWKTGEDWHVQYIVKAFESIRTVITDNADGSTVCDYTMTWSANNRLGTTEDTIFYPRLYFACVDANISNIYVGYDVTNDVASLKTAATDAKAVSTEGYTAASVNAFNEAIAAAETIANACTDAYTNPYSKAEINAAETAIATAQAALVAPTAQLIVGGGKVNEVKYGIANGEVLPTGYVEDKYIISWTLDGAAVTNYDASVTNVTKYVADFIDTDMLDVYWQQSTKETNSTVYRFIGSVNDTDKYSAVGFEFSLDESKWYPLGSMTTVYAQIKENNGTQTAAQIYGNEYSEYLFVKPLDFGSYKEVYVRAYVILNDGETVVYGETSLKNVDAYEQE